MIFSDPQSFNQLKLGLCLLPRPFHDYAYTLLLKTSPILLFGETLLWETFPMFSLLAARNKSFLLPIFDSVVSFGSIPTKRQTQFLGNNVTLETYGSRKEGLA